MHNIFKSVHPDVHSCVLELDRAMRREASFDSNFALTDQAHFTVLTTTLLSSIGGAGSSYESGASSPRSRK